MRKSIVAAVLAASAATSACGRTHSEDGGPAVSRNYQVGGFDKIEVAGPYDVEVRTGANPSVSARGPQKMIEHMTVEVRDGKLLIRPERQHGWFQMGWNSHGHVALTVTVPELHGAAIAGSGGVKTGSGKAQTANFDIAGSGDIDAKGVQVQTADVSIAGSGSIAAQATGTAAVSIMGSGDVQVTGGAKCTITKAGSGDVRCS